MLVLLCTLRFSISVSGGDISTRVRPILAGRMRSALLAAAVAAHKEGILLKTFDDVKLKTLCLSSW